MYANIPFKASNANKHSGDVRLLQAQRETSGPPAINFLGVLWGPAKIQ
jgi:hypothetical protein